MCYKNSKSHDKLEMCDIYSVNTLFLGYFDDTISAQSSYTDRRLYKWLIFYTTFVGSLLFSLQLFTLQTRYNDNKSISEPEAALETICYFFFFSL